MSYVEGLLGDGERILIIARRHALFLVGRLILFVIAALILIAAGVWAFRAVSIYLGIALWIASLLPLALAMIRLVEWRNEQYIVTNDRIIQVEGMVSRRVLDSSLEKVNDILLTQSLMGRLFDFGTIEIITGSDIGLNRLDALSHPFVFKRAIVDARNALENPRTVQEAPVDHVAQLLAALGELRNSGLLTEAEYEIKRDRLIGNRART